VSSYRNIYATFPESVGDIAGNYEIIPAFFKPFVACRASKKSLPAVANFARILLVWLMLSALPAHALEQILRVGNGQEPESLDPHRSEGVSNANILRDLYEGLTGISPTGAVVPAAAEHWSVDAQGLEYTFYLRDDARWSNGDPVTAEDFAAGMQRSVDPATGSPYSLILSPIENAEAISAGRLPPAQLGVTAVDDHVLRIRLRGPTPFLPGLLAHQAAFPVHRPSLQRYGRDFARPGRLIGNGAYRLLDWAVQAQVTLVRNPYYWNDAHTNIDRVLYYPTEDVTSELARYRAGELDITYSIPMSQAQQLRGTAGSELHLAPYFGTYYYGFNLARPPFKDSASLRLALSMAVDRQVIAEKVLHGAAAPAYGWVPPGTWNYTPQQPEWAGWPPQRRAQEARRLYAAAGYSPSHPLQLELRFNTQEDNRRVAIVIAAMWKQNLGVQTQLVNEEWKVFVQNRKLHRLTQAFRASWIGDYDDATAFLDVLRSFDGQNDESYQRADYDGLLAEAQMEPDAQRRKDLLEHAERTMLADGPIMPIFFYLSKHLVRSAVGGWQDNPLDVHYVKDMRLNSSGTVVDNGAGHAERR
jgi:oligopeptide transport system substrate-binding protein